MGQAQQRPATLSKAIAGMLANPKGWQERVEKMTALAEALNRQVGLWGTARGHGLHFVMPKVLKGLIHVANRHSNGIAFRA
jgi:hypothetical protein